jgi:hypothetical protein
MKKMKKIISSILALALVAVFCIPAFAASGINTNEQKLIDEIKNGVKISGKTYNVDQYKTTLENYLNRDDVDLTEAQASTVLSDMNKAVALFETESGKAALTSGEIKVRDLSTADKNAFVSYVNDAAKALNVTVTWDASGVVTIKDAKGNIILQQDPSIKTSAIKNTDTVSASSFAPVYWCIGICAVIAAGAMTVSAHSKKSKAVNK